ncbi:MAG TPA: hypothetical protein VFL99_09060 [Segeticoccus sp.]|uniref:hypothetical protein n=1 Tax=Segeticoccus sp. TaxID=2706531 RepID=UPI002D8050BC|nr:hypothetical protein [Segeticoccus sp.]HET8600462.1 hypothetical protein [Segeticoccus sp.]
MSWFAQHRPRRPGLPDSVKAALELPHGERVLAFAVDDNTAAHVVATNWSVIVVASNGVVTLRKPWHLADAGSWNQDLWTLTITWVDGSQAAQWSFKNQSGAMAQAVHERVQSSVVLAAQLAFPGQGRGRVVIRRDHATGELLEQTLLGRGVRRDDPEVQQLLRATLDELRDQVGLPPER